MKRNLVFWRACDRPRFEAFMNEDCWQGNVYQSLNDISMNIASIKQGSWDSKCAEVNTRALESHDGGREAVREKIFRVKETQHCYILVTVSEVKYT